MLVWTNCLHVAGLVSSLDLLHCYGMLKLDLIRRLRLQDCCCCGLDIGMRACLQSHMQHMVAYGVGNAKRWAAAGGSGPPGRAMLDFTVGMEDRNACIRIPHSVLLQKRGWCAVCLTPLQRPPQASVWHRATASTLFTILDMMSDL